MAAAAEEDTELRDLLVQTLESSGVLNKIKVRAEGLSSVCSVLAAVRGVRCRSAAAALARGCSAGRVPSSRHRPAPAVTALWRRPPSRRCPRSARIGAVRGAVSSAHLSQWSHCALAVGPVGGLLCGEAERGPAVLCLSCSGCYVAAGVPAFLLLPKLPSHAGQSSQNFLLLPREKTPNRSPGGSVFKHRCAGWWSCVLGLAERKKGLDVLFAY